ncbi:MAG: hypothetical protein K9L61_02295 [Candidatus Omnitrophica bacterium]|nr:hypothetical protein [Candidatus Omnitrophota bacterium]
MKKVIVSVLGFIFILSGPAKADQVSELKGQLEDLREKYETKIDQLSQRISKLEKNQKEEVAKINEKIDKNLLDVEYVGRYEGPFKKGGLIIDNPFGFGNVSLGGYMDHEFENFQNTNSTFDQHRWILNIGAELGERLRFYSEYEIEHGGPDASGGGEAKVEQAWVDYLISDGINLRAGAVLVPFGRYNIYHDSDLQDLTSRPLVARDIIPTTWTESGAGFHGEFNPKLGDYQDLVISYETYVINGLDDGFSDTGMRGARGSLGGDNNNNKAVVGRLSLSPTLGHEIGLSGYRGKYNNSGDYINGTSLDLASRFGPLELIGEYAYFNIDEPSGSDVAKTMEGYRIQANYHFWPKFFDNTFLGEGFDDPTFTLVGRYGWAKIDDDSDLWAGDNEEERYTLGLNYRPVESWVFKLEYQWNDTKSESLERGSNNGFMASVAMGF